MSDHAETALDQLNVAEHLTDRFGFTWQREHTHALAVAQVHALLDVATAIREAGALALIQTALAP